MRLHHLHLPSPIPYTHSLRLQEALVERHLADKILIRSNPSVKSRAPPPTLLTFQTHPTYTVGRRHLKANPLSDAQISYLTGQSSGKVAQNEAGHATKQLATFFPSPRGGLLTYHAPGQLTAYLILNLRTHNLTPRCYIRMLENTVIRTCARHGVPNVMTTEDPGVWVAEESVEGHSNAAQASDSALCPVGSTQALTMIPTNRKICAIGVHVSSGITSHGIGLNVCDAPVEGSPALKGLYVLPRDNVYTSGANGAQSQQGNAGVLKDGQTPATGYLSWGFSRIVACGLEGKSVTWLQRELEQRRGGEAPPKIITIEAVADALASEVARGLGMGDRDIKRLNEEQILE